jgi:hypothetical protein
MTRTASRFRMTKFPRLAGSRLRTGFAARRRNRLDPAAGRTRLKEIQVDVIDLKYDSNEAVRATLPDYIIQMLSDLGVVNTGRRPAFKKIIRS